LTADDNAEMLEQVARYGRVRDRAIYLGDYGDLVPERFGPGLPLIADWAREHFDAVGYAGPIEPDEPIDAEALRDRLGYRRDELLIIAAVGGTAAGRHLLAKVAAAWPVMREALPSARLVLICGPRIDVGAFAEQPGVEVRGYVHRLYEHLACCDLGIVQGGLSTTMELTLARRPFLYFPLADHCEQQLHVSHRLQGHGAGRRMDYATTSPQDLAQTALTSLDQASATALPRPGAARRAAQLIAELL
jgi:predicted glycosyltransferase